MPDFKSLLNKKMDDIERPSILPAGRYEGLIVDYATTEAQNEEKTPILRVNVKLTGATNDIDANDLIDSKGKDIKVAERRMRIDYFATEETLWRIKEMIKTCGIDDEGRSIGECLPEIKGAPVYVEVTQTPDKQKKNEDGTPVVYNNIQSLVGQRGAQS